jgi:hypothetical protein
MHTKSGIDMATCIYIAIGILLIGILLIGIALPPAGRGYLIGIIGAFAGVIMLLVGSIRLVKHWLSD